MFATLNPPITLKVITNIDEAIAAFPSEVIRRYAADFTLTEEEAKLHALELVRYLVMCAENPDAEYGMSGQVDEVWHLMILHTMEYARWCHQIFGYFVHHTPTLPEEKEQVRAGDAPDTYGLFYQDYALYFGERPSAVWPAPHGQLDCGGSSCSSSSPSSCSSPSCSSPSCSSPAPSPSCSSRRDKRRR